MAVTILDVAKARGVKEDDQGSINAAEFDRVGLPFMGGCEGCGASIACYNAYPSRSEYIRCADCIGDHGFRTVEEFEEFSRVPFLWCDDECDEQTAACGCAVNGNFRDSNAAAMFLCPAHEAGPDLLIACKVLMAPWKLEGGCTEENPFGQATVTLPNGEKVDRIAFVRSVLARAEDKRHGAEKWIKEQNSGQPQTEGE